MASNTISLDPSVRGGNRGLRQPSPSFSSEPLHWGFLMSLLLDTNLSNVSYNLHRSPPLNDLIYTYARVAGGPLGESLQLKVKCLIIQLYTNFTHLYLTNVGKGGAFYPYIFLISYLYKPSHPSE